MIVDPHEVIRIVREVSTRAIVPRFRNLSAGDIRDKGRHGDLVTIADEESERMLSERLLALLPGSAVVGEEAAEADPGLLASLAEAAPTWLLDPVDGTVNFASGKPCFAVIVGLSVRGETHAGWIHDPLAGTTMWAIQERGAWLHGDGGERAVRVSPQRELMAMRGSLSRRSFRALQKSMPANAAGSQMPKAVRYGCAGREYMDLCCGNLDFAQYRRLKPWDHAAGVLIHRESGGYSILRRSRTAYRPDAGIIEDTLLLASDMSSWHLLDSLLGADGMD